jgi:hypothetical protein
MWTCPKCRETVDDELDTCWSCGTGQDGSADSAFRPEADAPLDELAEAVETVEAEGLTRAGDPLLCPRCHCKLRFMGTKAFHEGPRYGFLGEIGELFVNRQKFDVYCCGRCGRVEFFVDGVGERFRRE